VRIALKLTLVLIAGICAVLGVVMRMQVQRETDLFIHDSAHDNALMGRWLGEAAQQAEVLQGRAEADRFIKSADNKSKRVNLRRVQPEDMRGAVPLGGEEAGCGYKVDLERRNPRADLPGVILTYVPLPGDLGILEVEESLEDERRYVHETVVRHLLTAGAIAGVCGVMALGLGLLLVGRPVSWMVAQTRRVGAGDLSGRLTPRGHDELADLGREIDRMVEALGEAGARLDAETAAKIETVEQLRRADRLVTVGKLASGVAHELGTPLNIASARAKMIATGEVADGEARESARVVMEQTVRMSRIIRQLLDFARPRRPAREPLDIGSVARQVASLLSPMAHPRGVRIECADDAGPVAASIDGSQVQQVLSNLVVNAIQASTGGGRVVVDWAVRRARPPADVGGPAAEYAVIGVEDEGVGIPEANLVHIFEPFFTTKEVGEGTGLGLPVSNGIVREHGGWIGVSSRPGRTRFEVFLPRGTM
jgi:signal transduction histidine kinase